MISTIPKNAPFELKEYKGRLSKVEAMTADRSSALEVAARLRRAVLELGA